METEGEKKARETGWKIGSRVGEATAPKETKPMEWQKKVFLVFVAFVIYQWIPHYIQILGVTEDVYNHEPGPCRFVQGLDGGSEDVQTLPDGRTFITSGFIRFYNRSIGVKGRVLFYDMSKLDVPPITLKLEGMDEENFTPQGLSVYLNPNTGKISLFIVNHHPNGDRVEKFRFIPRTHTLIHQKSYWDTRMTQANDVAAVSEDSFYFTNYLYTLRPTLKLMEMYMPLRWGSVFFMETGHRPRLVVNKLKQPNGILFSRDNKLVYVAHEGFQELLIYDRLPDDSLQLNNVIPLNTSVDNLSLSPDGTEVWLGGHAVFWKIQKQISDPDYPAPSQVLRLDLENGLRLTKVSEIYSNDGSVLKGSSVATFYNDHVLIGTVLHKTLLCELQAMDEDEDLNKS